MQWLVFLPVLLLSWDLLNMEIKPNQLMAKARNNDAQQQTTRKLITSRFITERQS